MKTKPKPCPFCGIDPNVWLSTHIHVVKCINIACEATPSVIGPTRAEALKAWNTRHEARPKGESK